MGVQGVAFNPKKTDITDAIKKYKGVLSLVARHFNVYRSTIYEYFQKNPEFNELLKLEREQYVEDAVDEAEETMIKLLRRADDEPGVAFKSAQYILNNQGRKRNYNHPEVEAAEKSVGMLDRMKELKVLPPNDSSK